MDGGVSKETKAGQPGEGFTGMVTGAFNDGLKLTHVDCRLLTPLPPTDLSGVIASVALLVLPSD